MSRSVPQIVSVAAIAIGIVLFVLTLTFIDFDDTLESAKRLGFAEGIGLSVDGTVSEGAGENLFLKADGWDAPDIPLMIERQPFLIGRNGDEMLVHVDLDSPRVALRLAQGSWPPRRGHAGFVHTF